MQAKKIFKLIAAAVMLAAVVAVTVSCDSNNRYKKLDKSGYTVSVTFDPGDGEIKGTNSLITDVFNLDDYTVGADGKINISLLPPDSTLRDPANPLTVTKNEHFLAGWYTERTPIDPGNPERGYTYSGKWDFDKDRLSLDPDGDYTSAENQLTLYAAWIPYYEFEIYSVDDNGSTALLSKHKGINLAVPKWVEGKAEISMGSFPKRSGYTLDAVYLDRECTMLAGENVTGGYDEECGTVTVSKVKLYTTWNEGTYYKIYTADDLRSNADANATYELMCDIDFSKTRWSSTFQNSKFSGTIIGNGHKISTVTVNTTAATNKSIGLFGQITEKAVIKDVIFENITHLIDTGRVVTDATLGLLTGSVSDGATIENVTVGGKILIGDKCQGLKSSSFTIGLVSGTGTPDGVTVSDVKCEKENPDNQKLTFEIETDDNGFVTLVFSK